MSSEYKELGTVSPLYGKIQKLNTKSVKPLRLNDQKILEILADGEKDVLESPNSRFCTNKKLPNSLETYKKMISVKKKVEC